VRKISLYLAQSLALFLGPLALGDVHYRTDEFNEIAGWTENGMAYGVDVPDPATGMNDSVIELELPLFTACAFELFQGTGLIIGVYALKE
jgi:hypothetical protein